MQHVGTACGYMLSMLNLMGLVCVWDEWGQKMEDKSCTFHFIYFISQKFSIQM